MPRLPLRPLFPALLALVATGARAEERRDPRQTVYVAPVVSLMRMKAAESDGLNSVSLGVDAADWSRDVGIQAEIGHFFPLGPNPWLYSLVVKWLPENLAILTTKASFRPGLGIGLHFLSSVEEGNRVNAFIPYLRLETGLHLHLEKLGVVLRPFVDLSPTWSLFTQGQTLTDRRLLWTMGLTLGTAFEATADLRTESSF
jgi:hypothetical protein